MNCTGWSRRARPTATFSGLPPTWASIPEARWTTSTRPSPITVSMLILCQRSGRELQFISAQQLLDQLPALQIGGRFRIDQGEVVAGNGDQLCGDLPIAARLHIAGGHR